jgi:hypothetical protein
MFNIECHSAKSIKEFSFYPEEEEVLLPPGRQFQVIGCLDQGHGLHIIQMREIQPKFPLINPVPQPSNISSEPKKNLVQQPPPPPPVKQATKTLTPPVKQATKTLIPPNCGNPELQKHIDALYSDPVIISFKAIAFIFNIIYRFRYSPFFKEEKVRFQECALHLYFNIFLK